MECGFLLPGVESPKSDHDDTDSHKTSKKLTLHSTNKPKPPTSSYPTPTSAPPTPLKPKSAGSRSSVVGKSPANSKEEMENPQTKIDSVENSTKTIAVSKDVEKG